MFWDALDGGRERIQEESRLLNHLMTNYDREVRPVYNASHKVVVSVGITLTQIFDMVSKITTLINMSNGGTSVNFKAGFDPS